MQLTKSLLQQLTWLLRGFDRGTARADRSVSLGHTTTLPRWRWSTQRRCWRGTPARPTKTRPSGVKRCCRGRVWLLQALRRCRGRPRQSSSRTLHKGLRLHPWRELRRLLLIALIADRKRESRETHTPLNKQRWQKKSRFHSPRHKISVSERRARRMVTTGTSRREEALHYAGGMVGSTTNAAVMPQQSVGGSPTLPLAPLRSQRRPLPQPTASRALKRQGGTRALGAQSHGHPPHLRRLFQTQAFQGSMSTQGPL